MSFQASGIGGKPTIQFSGVNVQVVNGTGVETALNGEGNLVVGYDPKPLTQTGSHNLVLGTTGQSYTSFGGLLAGDQNQIAAPEAAITGGCNNDATGPGDAITGGQANLTSGVSSSVGGGLGNNASGDGSAITGGASNRAKGADSSILGGVLNVATGNDGTVSGGDSNTAGGGNSSANSVSGGTGNTANGTDSWVGGGAFNTAGGQDSSAGGTLPQSVPVNSSNWSTPGCCGSRSAQWYSDNSGIVHLEGAVTQTNATSVGGSDPNLIGTLPAAASPSQTVFTIVHTGSGTYADLAINPQGQIFLISSFNTNATFVSLEGITYRQ